MIARARVRILESNPAHFPTPVLLDGGETTTYGDRVYLAFKCELEVVQ